MQIPADLAQTLATTVDEGSLDAAARALHITQPAVSQRLRTLERLTGQVLLVRSRPVRPTPAGEVVVRYARQIAQLDAEASASLGLEGASRPVLSIGVNADSLATWFLTPLARLAQRHGVIFDLHRDDEGRTADLLVNGTVAAAVTTRHDPVPGCTVTRLGTESYRAVASADFARRWFPSGVTAEALASAPLVDVDSEDQLQTRYLEARGVDPALPPRHRIPTTPDFARAIEMGIAWGLMPQAQRESAAGIVDLGGPDITVDLYWQQWRVRSRLLDELTEEVTAEARRALLA
ncbi:LysR family transcriptional regulator ArgP [Demequina capsici]|uniref:LysR family transcriptional regulator ArgP n=1 Tax=Demequina capsici TaxID=3075620 RepID=A0AA96F3G0_9MICO|nr:LysR family transcriptional regulator ArgP [Demequina sp. OYTSA14]WNM23289.1 LysR family transcriptional regulator ArgP [Demequina sp. OYTSA14]